MGEDKDLLVLTALELQAKGAPRIDRNCGCPSNTVVGKGAGSSLLKDPKHLYELSHALSSALSCLFTVKMRSGYEDTSLFSENVLALREAKVDFITLHPRSKKEGYKGKADWSLIAKAKELSQLPVVGSGDILSAEDALRMYNESHCDGLMVGRGAVRNPWIFQEIKALFRGENPKNASTKNNEFLLFYFAELESRVKERHLSNRVKQLICQLFLSHPYLKKKLRPLLRKKQSYELLKKCVLDYWQKRQLLDIL